MISSRSDYDFELLQLMQPPQRREIMIGLMEDLRENLEWFPNYQAYLREHQR